MEKPKIDKSDCRRLNFDNEDSLNNKSRPTTDTTSTGAIQKRKSSYKTIRPSNSLKYPDNGSEILIFQCKFG